MMLTVPIFFPIVVNLGYDPIWFGIIIVLVTHMGIITPPVGISVYIIRGIAQDVLIALVVGVAAMIAIPEIVTGFPSIFE